MKRERSFDLPASPTAVQAVALSLLRHGAGAPRADGLVGHHPSRDLCVFVELTGRSRRVEGAVAEHDEENVCPAAGEAEDGLGVVLALLDLLVVVAREATTRTVALRRGSPLRTASNDSVNALSALVPTAPRTAAPQLAATAANHERTSDAGSVDGCDHAAWRACRPGLK